ncbi:SGNH/GDSL hydrolase family protein [Leifsonia bigeumensis]|uniref:SGNH/GDSL hydrolase family protein n=1 Tax=Leifsonella bigeumensis TaxID=433643 RepID=A0ABP7FAG9_9MICO
MQFRSYVAIGDSFTEGVGDDLPDGGVRGWADLVALGLALAARERDGQAAPPGAAPFGYANLAIRGRLLGPIIEEQLDAAIALRPDLLSLNGGGNDIMRPKVSVESVADRLAAAAEKAMAAGIHVLLLSGGNPTRHIPLGARIEVRGEQLARAVRARVPASEKVTFVDNWADAELTDLRYWSVDKLHLNPLGHRRVASNVLTGLGVAVPDWGDERLELKRPGTIAYWRGYVLPWIGRRLTGRSSGDGREPKRPTLLPIDLA